MLRNKNNNGSGKGEFANYYYKFFSSAIEFIFIYVYGFAYVHIIAYSILFAFCINMNAMIFIHPICTLFCVHLNEDKKMYTNRCQLKFIYLFLFYYLFHLVSSFCCLSFILLLFKTFFVYALVCWPTNYQKIQNRRTYRYEQQQQQQQHIIIMSIKII